MEQAVRMERIGISELSRKLNVSRRTIYNWFGQEDLNPHIILKIGEVIGHDFTVELPEAFIGKHKAMLNAEHHVATDGVQIDSNPVYFWMNKYVSLLEKYNELLNLLSETARNNRKELDKKKE